MYTCAPSKFASLQRSGSYFFSLLPSDYNIQNYCSLSVYKSGQVITTSHDLGPQFRLLIGRKSCRLVIHFIPSGQNVLSITPSKSTIHVRIGKYTIDASYEIFMLPEPGPTITFTFKLGPNKKHTPHHTANGMVTVGVFFSGTWGGC